MANHSNQSFTKYGWWVCTWVLVVSFQYGYHISALNQIQAVLTCRVTDKDSPFEYGLPTCIPMSDATFSVVTAVFTVGGLLGSLVANLVMDKWGRKGATRVSAALVAVGAGAMGVSSTIALLVFGRLLVGMGAGVGLCVGPIFLAEIAPAKIKANVGVLTQLAIVIGILVTQVIGLNLATPKQWRAVLILSSILSVVQFFLSPAIVESPSWLKRKGFKDDHKASSESLWGNQFTLRPDPLTADVDVEDPLLGELEETHEEVHEATISVPQLLKAPELRRPLMIVSFSMLAQQVSGINAVLYYSNDILSKSLPEWGPYISLLITVVNVMMTFPTVFLIEHMGRKPLLRISVGGAVFSLIAVGYGLNSNLVALSSVAILTFVMSFAIGLGPVPFVMIPEVSPIHAVSALSSVGLSLNWISNFIVGLAFLPLRNFLSHGDATKEGRVFFVFATLLFGAAFSLSRVYR